MSKQFIKGNVYVFTRKKYLEDKSKQKNCSGLIAKASSTLWARSINGNEVIVKGKWCGEAGGMFVVPEWCKCIKNNNPKIESEEI
jgi:hypothetical protein